MIYKFVNCLTTFLERVNPMLKILDIDLTNKREANDTTGIVEFIKRKLTKVNNILHNTTQKTEKT